MRSGNTVTLTRKEYEALIDRIEEADDRADFARHAQTPKERMLPMEEAGRILNGEHPLRVWREHRGLTTTALADAAGLARSYLTEIETGRKPGSVAAYRALAAALDVTVDDLLPDA
jgi:DNA-binding XRE family transcriptional regulator